MPAPPHGTNVGASAPRIAQCVVGGQGQASTGLGASRMLDSSGGIPVCGRVLSWVAGGHVLRMGRAYGGGGGAKWGIGMGVKGKQGSRGSGGVNAVGHVKVSVGVGAR